MRRVLEPEWLDHLPADDPQARGSRRDLRRLNVLMGHARLLTRLYEIERHNVSLHSRPLRVVELGAGDGTFFLKVARRWKINHAGGQVMFLDRQNLVTAETRQALKSANWTAESVASDVFAWLEKPSPPVDLMFANLFLHHFAEDELRTLFNLAAARTKVFIACEPRRNRVAWVGSRLTGWMGCNAVTRHDAVVSVHAAFAGRELSALWPDQGSWDLSEGRAGLFSHWFRARGHG